MVRFCKEYLIYFFPILFLIYIILESYQIDFRAFYLAGKSVLYHLDPYLNHVSLFPEFYGPVNSNNAPTSGLVYPPFAALIFTPLACFSYPIAKIVFSIFIIFMLFLLCFHFVKQSKFIIQGEAILFIICSFPVITTFERGQIDILIVCLTVFSFYLYNRHKLIFPSSLLLATAICIKIFPIFTLIYYLYKKEFKLIIYTFVGTFLLFIAPLIYFNPTVYLHFFQVMLPNLFGHISNSVPINTHGQDVINNIVISNEISGLIASRNISNGYMNPLLKNNTIGALIFGLLSTVLMLISSKKKAADANYQFYAILNTINLFNPRAWIMGLVWYIPFFLFLYNKVTKLGRILILLPLFVPPFTNINAFLAYVVSLLFVLALNNQNLSKRILLAAKIE